MTSSQLLAVIIAAMAAAQGAGAKRFVVIHIATTCDEHGVYVTKDSAETIELGWILLDANNLEEVLTHGILTLDMG